MKKLITKSFSKWAIKQNIPYEELAKAIQEIESGNFEANLGGHILKKRVRFQGKGKQQWKDHCLLQARRSRYFCSRVCKKRKIESNHKGT